MGRLLRMTIKVPQLALYVSTLTLFLLAFCALFLGTVRWWLEITTHFIHLYFLAACSLLLCAAIYKNKFLLALNGSIILGTGFLLLPYYLPHDQLAAQAKSEPAAPQFKILHLNPQAGTNRNYAATFQLVREQKPDLVAISEVESDWLQKLQHSLPDYPHKIITPVGGGIALLSKRPFTYQQIMYFGSRKRPRIKASMLLNGREIKIIAVHPYIPVRSRLKLRNEEFMTWVPEVCADKEPTIVIGDFNSSPWSPYLQQFLQNSRLYDSAIGFGVQPTWPADRAYIFPLTPIDNCFVSNHFVVTNRRTGPNIGSDHLPILVNLNLRNL